MQQIADQAGVSAQTVANVLQGRTRGAYGSAARRAERIRELAEDMGYRVNTAAQATRTGRFNTACMVASTLGHRSTMFRSLIHGAHDALAERNMHLTFAYVEDDRLTDPEFVPKALKEWTTDGLLLNYTQEVPPALVDLIERHRIPSVWINSQQRTDCVRFDDRDAGRRLTDHLLKLGHRRIAFAHYGAERHYSIHERRAGYADAMQAAGLTPRSIQRDYTRPTPDSAGDNILPLTRDWLDRPDRPTAVVTYSHVETHAARIVAAELGMSVPDDLSLATFSDSLDDGIGLQTARMFTPHRKLAHLAVAMLMDKIDAPPRRLEPRVMPLEFWEGRSCAPAPV